MDRSEFEKFNDRPCKFKFRGGREVFGVIWENQYGNKFVHFFSSAAERVRYKMAEKINDRQLLEGTKVPVALEDVVVAELLA